MLFEAASVAHLFPSTYTVDTFHEAAYSLGFYPGTLPASSLDWRQFSLLVITLVKALVEEGSGKEKTELLPALIVEIDAQILLCFRGGSQTLVVEATSDTYAPDPIVIIREYATGNDGGIPEINAEKTFGFA